MTAKNWLFAVAGLVLVAASIFLLIYKVEVPSTIAAMIVLGFLLIVFPHLPPFRVGMGDFSFETLQAQVKDLQQDAASERVSRSFLQKIAAVPVEQQEAVFESGTEADALAGKFGSASEANGRKLEAQVERIPGTDLATIRLTVRSMDWLRPLRGSVTFHLHETFKPYDVQTVPVNSEGIARLDLASWGAFTVGAVADDKTRLELDIKDAPGSFEPWNKR